MNIVSKTVPNCMTFWTFYTY